MRVRLGYVAMAIDLKDCSPSKTVTATNLAKVEHREDRINKLRKISFENLHNTLRILRYNAAYDIKVYRLTSKLIPLATHEMAEGWDYMEDLKDKFSELGEFISANDLRVSAHPDHFTLLNSPKEEVFIASLKDLDYHENIYNAMGLDTKAKLVIHVGGLYKEREISIQRFLDNYKKVSDSLKHRIIVENDDKIYTAKEVLDICQTLNIPMVLDVHHDRCNPSDKDIREYIEPIFKTWEGQGVPPKIHLSSPKSERDIRSHADYIDKQDFLTFLYKAREVGIDFDVMIEAKMKNLALHKLMEDIKGEESINIVNGAEIMM